MKLSISTSLILNSSKNELFERLIENIEAVIIDDSENDEIIINGNFKEIEEAIQILKDSKLFD